MKDRTWQEDVLLKGSQSPAERWEMKSRAFHSGRTWIIVPVILVLLFLGAFFIWVNWDYFLSSLCRPYREVQPTTPPKEELMPPPGQEPSVEIKEGEVPTKAPVETPKEKEPSPATGPSEAELKWAELTGQLPVWPEDFLSPRDCREVEKRFRSLCRELDSRPYIQAMRLPNGTYGIFTETLKRLAMHPPVASGELLRFESVTANVFHLFRTLGKGRLLILREILVREGDLAEPIAMTIFRWLMARKRCGPPDNPMTRRLLYDYSSYLLNTLGGLGYIYRRPPRIAGLTTFYALVILDQAIQEGLNPHGVDPRPHIKRCRELISTQDLIFRDKYLEVLDELAKRWGAY
jgi:hypothetical protein